MTLVSASDSMHCLLVGDARPQLNAYTNKVGGWGYEEANVYDFLELRFLNIDNIHKVRTERQL